MVRMRRAPAILLVFLFSFSLIAPALSVGDESNLPACCRRDGKHHCGMMARDMADAPSSGLLADATRMRCPFFPGAGAVVPEAAPVLLAASQTAGISTVAQIADQAQAEAGYRISFHCSHHKRGPPTILA